MATVMKRSQLTTIAFVLSLVAGVLLLIEGFGRLGQGRALVHTGVNDNVAVKFFAGATLYEIGVAALLFGSLILVGAILMFKTSMILAGSLVVLVFSILSIAVGGLGVISFIIGTIGSILALANK